MLTFNLFCLFFATYLVQTYFSHYVPTSHVYLTVFCFSIRKRRPEAYRDLLNFEDHAEARRVQDPGLWNYHQRHIVHFIQQVRSSHSRRGGSKGGIFKFFMEPRNRFQGIASASLCSLAGRYDNPIPARFLAPNSLFPNSSTGTWTLEPSPASYFELYAAQQQ
jgi:hypothetical protein